MSHKAGVWQTDGQNYDSQDRASIAASRGKMLPHYLMKCRTRSTDQSYIVSPTSGRLLIMVIIRPTLYSNLNFRQVTSQGRYDNLLDLAFRSGLLAGYISALGTVLLEDKHVSSNAVDHWRQFLHQQHFSVILPVDFSTNQVQWKLTHLLEDGSHWGCAVWLPLTHITDDFYEYLGTTTVLVKSH